MTGTNTTFTPDYAAPPGWMLEEMLEEREWSHAEFARKCDRSPKLISEIISGQAPITSQTAIEFQRVLGMKDIVWLNMEAAYQLHKARVKDAELQAQNLDWAKQFPLSEMRKLDLVSKRANDPGIVDEVLSAFGVASIDAWENWQENLSVACRHSATYKSSREALATWLRLGELSAEKQECKEYKETNFKAALSEIRDLTLEQPDVFLPKMKSLLNEAGIAYAIIPSLKKTALSGATRWINPRKAIIQQSVKHLVNDHFWFTFFHEAAHILLHSKKTIFIDEKGHNGSEFEVEANDWAANFLINREKYDDFKDTMPRSSLQVQDFAHSQGIHPGIVVGMLQHDKIVRWDRLNNLKQKYQWCN